MPRLSQPPPEQGPVSVNDLVREMTGAIPTWVDVDDYDSGPVGCADPECSLCGPIRRQQRDARGRYTVTTPEGPGNGPESPAETPEPVDPNLRPAPPDAGHEDRYDECNCHLHRRYRAAMFAWRRVQQGYPAPTCAWCRRGDACPYPNAHCRTCGQADCERPVCTSCQRCSCTRCAACLSCWCSGPCSGCNRCSCPGPCSECNACGCDGPCTYCDSCDCDGDCEEHPNSRAIPVRSYSYRPTLVFQGRGPLFLGMELEIETRNMNRSLRAVNDHFGRLVICKEDGSINNGFEIVTQPMDWPYVEANFPWSGLDALRESGAYIRPMDNGIHVHVSRAGFTDALHQFRWMKFLHRNQEAVTAIARRDSGQWAAWHRETRRRQKFLVKPSLARNPYNGVGVDRWGDPNYDPRREGRYQAINTTNESTFELRVFAASLVQEEVGAALGLASSSVEYTRSLTTQDILKDNGWSWARYSDWLKQTGTYSALQKEITRLCAS